MLRFERGWGLSAMRSDWTRTNWGELATLEYGKALRGYQDAEGPFRVFGTNGPIGWHSEPLCETAGVVIGRKGAYRGVHYSAAPFFVIDTAFYLKPKVDLDVRWAYYQLLSIDINSMDSGSAIPSTSRDEFYKLPVLVPSRQEQTHIADTLEAFDRRIDLLRQTNATLESIAEALFISWFVDFDPVRAKAERREPEGMDAETTALFPDGFEESALGAIPIGWRVGTLVNAVDINPARSLTRGAEAPYLEMANAPTSGHRPIERVGLRAFGSGCKFRNGDALLAKITPCLENGKSAYVDFLDDDAVGWGSTEFIVMRSKPLLPEYGAYLLARYEPFRLFAIQAMTGTSGRQRVDLGRLAQFPMALPPNPSIAQATTSTFGALQARIASNDEQAKVLAELRDALLPRLVSGRLRIPEAFRAVETATA